MSSVLACYSPDDTLLVDQTAVIRVVDYADPSVTLEIRAVPDAPPRTITLDSEWSNIVGALEGRYRGIFVNDKCQPSRRAGIEFRDTAKVDLRRHSLKGVPIRGASPMGRDQ